MTYVPAWKPPGQPHRRFELSKQGLVFYADFTVPSNAFVHDQCRGGRFPSYPPAVDATPNHVPIVDTEPMTATLADQWSDSVFGKCYHNKSSFPSTYITGPVDVPGINLPGDFTLVWRGMCEDMSAGVSNFMMGNLDVAGGWYWKTTGTGMQINSRNGGTDRFVTPDLVPALNQGEWKTLIWTRSPTIIGDVYPRIYVDGVYQHVGANGAWIAPAASTLAFGINSYVTNQNGGYCAEVRVYNRGMNQNEISLITSGLG